MISLASPRVLRARMGGHRTCGEANELGLTATHDVGRACRPCATGSPSRSTTVRAGAQLPPTTPCHCHCHPHACWCRCTAAAHHTMPLPLAQTSQAPFMPAPLGCTAAAHHTVLTPTHSPGKYPRMPALRARVRGVAHAPMPRLLVSMPLRTSASSASAANAAAAESRAKHCCLPHCQRRATADTAGATPDAHRDGCSHHGHIPLALHPMALPPAPRVEPRGRRAELNVRGIIALCLKRRPRPALTFCLRQTARAHRRALLVAQRQCRRAC